MLILSVILSFVLGMFFGALCQKFIFNRTTFSFKVNQNKRPNQADDYWHLSDDGCDYLFTDTEVIKAKLRAQKNPEDIED